MNNRLKGVGGAFDLLSNLIVIVIAIALMWFGSTGGSLDGFVIIILGVVLFITQLMALIG
ncbi:MAG: hypothetical protein HZB65_03480 [Candidatus Aenigmarchaeota archaeon]|nr:hypothetical protein [Candidatus Aenigmarchaeota archaeon]